MRRNPVFKKVCVCVCVCVSILPSICVCECVCIHRSIHLSVSRTQNDTEHADCAYNVTISENIGLNLNILKKF